MAGKKYKEALKKIDREKRYSLEEAVKLVVDNKVAKFDETVEIAVRLGVDPRQADQNVRGTIVLPHGTGSTARVLVVAKGEKEREAREAGADFVGGDDIIKKIQEENWLDFDRVIATPDMMGQVGTYRQNSRTARPDAQSESRHRYLRRRQGRRRNQGR